MKNESGRTMLEMLGVLAIMGIITYGAIAGINYGMSSYKINQTYSEVQDIVQGVEDLYSWTKGYPPPGHTATSGDFSGCPKIIAAACENDVLQGCVGNSGDDRCSGKGVFGKITIEATNVNGNAGDNFQVIVSIADGDERTRVSDMDWAAVNIDCNCSGTTCTFSPKSN